MEEYEYLSTLGEGAYGYVWKCQERSTGRIVAIKGFKQAHEEPEIMRLAVREVRVLQTLDHPAVIQLVEAFKSKSGRVYMVFPYVGRSAYQELDLYPDGLPPPLLKLLVWQLLQALVYLHRRKVVHRDIKPANILLSESGDVKLCDFGFARPTRCASRDAQRLSTYVVTRWYRAPEVLVSDLYGPSSDIWSLGCTIAELATGQALFPGKSTPDQLWRIMRCFGQLAPQQAARMTADSRLGGFRVPSRGRSVRERLPECEPGLLRLVEACLQLDPRQRPTAVEVLQMPYFWSVPKLLARSHLEKVYGGLLQLQQEQQEQQQQQQKQAAVMQQQKQPVSAMVVGAEKLPPPHQSGSTEGGIAAAAAIAKNGSLDVALCGKPPSMPATPDMSVPEQRLPGPATEWYPASNTSLGPMSPTDIGPEQPAQTGARCLRPRGSHKSRPVGGPGRGPEAVQSEPQTATPDERQLHEQQLWWQQQQQRQQEHWQQQSQQHLAGAAPAGGQSTAAIGAVRDEIRLNSGTAAAGPAAAAPSDAANFGSLLSSHTDIHATGCSGESSILSTTAAEPRRKVTDGGAVLAAAAPQAIPPPPPPRQRPQPQQSQAHEVDLISSIVSTPSVSGLRADDVPRSPPLRLLSPTGETPLGAAAAEHQARQRVANQRLNHAWPASMSDIPGSCANNPVHGAASTAVTCPSWDSPCCGAQGSLPASTGNLTPWMAEIVGMTTERTPSYLLASAGMNSTVLSTIQSGNLGLCDTVMFEDCTDMPAATAARLRAGLPAPNPCAGSGAGAMFDQARGQFASPSYSYLLCSMGSCLETHPHTLSTLPECSIPTDVLMLQTAPDAIAAAAAPSSGPFPLTSAPRRGSAVAAGLARSRHDSMMAFSTGDYDDVVAAAARAGGCAAQTGARGNQLHPPNRLMMSADLQSVVSSRQPLQLSKSARVQAAMAGSMRRAPQMPAAGANDMPASAMAQRGAGSYTGATSALSRSTTMLPVSGRSPGSGPAVKAWTEMGYRIPEPIGTPANAETGEPLTDELCASLDAAAAASAAAAAAAGSGEASSVEANSGAGAGVGVSCNGGLAGGGSVSAGRVSLRGVSRTALLGGSTSKVMPAAPAHYLSRSRSRFFSMSMSNGGTAGIVSDAIGSMSINGLACASTLGQQQGLWAIASSTLCSPPLSGEGYTAVAAVGDTYGDGAAGSAGIMSTLSRHWTRDVLDEGHVQDPAVQKKKGRLTKLLRAVKKVFTGPDGR